MRVLLVWGIFLTSVGLVFFPWGEVHFVFDEQNLMMPEKWEGGVEGWTGCFFRLEEETPGAHGIEGNIGRYRPFPEIFARLVSRIAGLNPKWWRVANLVLYLATIPAVHLLFREFLNGPGLWFATALFAFHPAHVEVVAWVLIFGNTLWGFLFFWALALERATRGKGNGLHRWGGRTLFLLSLFTREACLVFPLLVFFLPARNGDESGTEGRGGRLKMSLPFLMIVGIYLAFRMFALGGLGRIGDLSGEGWGRTLLSLPGAIVRYLGILVFPFCLSPVYPLEWVWKATDPDFWIPLGVFAVLLIPLVSFLRSRDEAGLRAGVLLMVFGTLPFLALGAFTDELWVQDRYLYIASAGFALVSGVFIRRIGTHFGKRFPAVLVVLALSLVLSATSFRQVGFWRDDQALFRRALHVAPRSFTAAQNLGVALLSVGEVDEAERLFRSNLERGFEAPALAGLGDSAFVRGDQEKAVDFYRASIALRPAQPATIFRNLGLSLFKLGRPEEARETFAALSASFPRSFEGHFFEGLALLSLGRAQEARKCLETAAALAPRNPDAYYFLGECLERMGKPEDAARHYRRALSLDPKHPKAIERLENLGGN